jgi:hypothetical protein
MYFISHNSAFKFIHISQLMGPLTSRAIRLNSFGRSQSGIKCSEIFISRLVYVTSDEMTYFNQNIWTS